MEFDGILEHQAKLELLTFLPGLRWFYREDVALCASRVRSLAATVRSHLHFEKAPKAEAKPDDPTPPVCFPV